MRKDENTKQNVIVLPIVFRSAGFHERDQPKFHQTLRVLDRTQRTEMPLSLVTRFVLSSFRALAISITGVPSTHCKGERLIGSPAHGGVHILVVY